MLESFASDQKLLLAAGGIVEQVIGDQVEIVLVHRTRYGNEWSLPKGKVKDGESLEQAALREVKEETGCEVHLGEFAGSTKYCTGGVEKQVFFWRMRVFKSNIFEHNDEVDELRWFAPDLAIQQLSHRNQADLVWKLYQRGQRLSRKKAES